MLFFKDNHNKTIKEVDETNLIGGLKKIFGTLIINPTFCNLYTCNQKSTYHHEKIFIY